MNTRERVRQEIEATRLVVHRLPDSILDEAFSLPGLFDLLRSRAD